MLRKCTKGHKCANVWKYKENDSTHGYVWQADQPIPSYFYDSGNSHSKRKKSSKTTMWQMEDPNFATPVHEVHFEIAIQWTLAVSPYAAVWHEGTRLQILENEQNGGHKADPFESKCD